MNPPIPIAYLERIRYRSPWKPLIRIDYDENSKGPLGASLNPFQGPREPVSTPPFSPDSGNFSFAQDSPVLSPEIHPPTPKPKRTPKPSPIHLQPLSLRRSLRISERLKASDQSRFVSNRAQPPVKIVPPKTKRTPTKTPTSVILQAFPSDEAPSLRRSGRISERSRGLAPAPKTQKLVEKVTDQFQRASPSDEVARRSHRISERLKSLKPNSPDSKFAEKLPGGFRHHSPQPLSVVKSQETQEIVPETKSILDPPPLPLTPEHKDVKHRKRATSRKRKPTCPRPGVKSIKLIRKYNAECEAREKAETRESIPSFG